MHRVDLMVGINQLSSHGQGRFLLSRGKSGNGLTQEIRPPCLTHTSQQTIKEFSHHPIGEIAVGRSAGELGAKGRGFVRIEDTVTAHRHQGDRGKGLMGGHSIAQDGIPILHLHAMEISTPARAVLGIGLGGLLLAVVNQATAAALDPPLERASVLASILAVVLMLVACLWTRVEPRQAGRADLVGKEGLELAPGIPPPLARELAWGSQMLLTATPAAVVLVQWPGTTLLRRGLLGEDSFQPGPTCERSLERQQVMSLVDLSLYPGRWEFDSLLPGLPAVVIQPLGQEGLLLLGGWAPRSFSRADLLWIEGWARRLTDEWAPVLGAAAAVSPDPNAEAP